MRPPTRRRLLTAAAGGVAALTALAGCSGGGDGSDPTTTDGTGDTTTTDDGMGGGTTTGDGTDGDTTTTTTEGGSGDGTTTTLKEDYSPPETEFQFVYDAEANSLLLANTGVGDFTAANTKTLAIQVDGEVAKEWALPVEGGDQTSVEADPGATVELVWTSPIDEREVVATYEVPSS